MQIIRVGKSHHFVDVRNTGSNFRLLVAVIGSLLNIFMEWLHFQVVLDRETHFVSQDLNIFQGNSRASHERFFADQERVRCNDIFEWRNVLHVFAIFDNLNIRSLAMRKGVLRHRQIIFVDL